MGIFSSLHIGYSGLQASQSGINTTSNNIANANVDGYSRQSISQKVNPPIHSIPGDVGNGTRVDSITRAHDEFVYGRLKSSSSQVAYATTMEKNLQEISTFGAGLDGLGVSKDIKDFFASWSDVAQNPGDEAQKIVLLRSMDSLTQNINQTSTNLSDIQDRLNSEFKNGINRVNDIASQISDINKNINKVESNGQSNANDLRDQRDRLELELSKMLNIDVSKGREVTEYGAKANKTDMGTDYNINVGGFNIVDGVSFHALSVEDAFSDSKLNSVFYGDNTQNKIDITDEIRGGKLGAILDLRGNKLDESGRAVDSKIQDYIDNLDSFSKTLIHSVNSIYAQSAQKDIVTDTFGEFGDSGKLSTLEGIKEGSFEVKVYNNLGEEVALRSITIDADTSLHKNQDGTINANSIIEQLNKNSDDNNDNDGTNDLDDLFTASMVDGKLRITSRTDENYTIAINDNGTNFAGVTGVNKLFSGDSASSISLESSIKNNPASISAHKAPIDGNADLANDMVALQYEGLTFYKTNGETSVQGLEEFHRYSSAQIASDAHQSVINKEASQVLNKTITDEFKSVSAVDMDEELVNLMMYQTAYQANAKVITAIDKMIDTLLGMK
jgi:flagellar hook-associated protein 1 FlgK